MVENGWVGLDLAENEGRRKLEKLDFLQVLKATLGTGNVCLQAVSVLHGDPSDTHCQGDLAYRR